MNHHDAVTSCLTHEITAVSGAGAAQLRRRRTLHLLDRSDHVGKVIAPVQKLIQARAVPPRVGAGRPPTHGRALARLQTDAEPPVVRRQPQRAGDGPTAKDMSGRMRTVRGPVTKKRVGYRTTYQVFLSLRFGRFFKIQTNF